jgi:transcriptional regulator with XRE-family HTH domain
MNQRRLAVNAGFSQEKFAAECNLDRTYISGIERGNVGLRNVEAIAIRISVSELMKGV